MRIGIDATPLPAEPVGAGTYILQLVHALASLDSEHDLFVFTHRNRSGMFADLPSKSVNIIQVQDRSPASRLVWEQANLPGFSRMHKLDLLHSLHYTLPLRLPCRSVVTFHDMTFFLYPKYHTLVKRLLFPIFIRISARRADQIIAVSETTRLDAIRILNIPVRKITTIPNGVSEEFHPISDVEQLEICRRKYSLPQDFILFVGTFEPRKNLPILLRAFGRLIQENPRYHLVLVGHTGWMVGEILNTIKQLHLERFIHTTGYVASSDLPLIYNLARVFVYPSIYEGFGLPPIEAMACGTPVVASSIPVNRDHIGDAGLLFPPGDEITLYEILLRLVNDQKFQEELSVKGYERSKKFSWHSCAQSTLAVYNSLESV